MHSGELIRKLRLLKELTQEGIAKEMGISQQAYSKLEKSSNISKDKLRDIFAVLRYSEKEIGIITTMFSIDK